MRSSSPTRARPSVLVADENPRYRRAVVRALEDLGYRAGEARSTGSALAEQRGAAVDALVVTVAMPSLEGHAILEEIANWPADVPVVVVGDGAYRRKFLSGLGTRASLFLTSPFSKRELDDALRQALSSPSGGGDQPIQDGGSPPVAPIVRHLVTELHCGEAELPAIAPIAGEVQRLLTTPECGVDEVLGVVGKDPAIAGSILRLANSSRYCATVPIRTLRTACLRLGNKRVLALAQEVLLRDLFAVGAGPLGALVAGMWQQVLVVAHGARAIAVELGSTMPDEVQVAAMLHDLGELALLRAIADRHLDASSWGSADFVERVAVEVRAHHESIGSLLLRAWGLDADLAKLAEYHHSPPRGAQRRREIRLRAIVVVAWAGAIRAGRGWDSGLPTPDVSRELGQLGLDLEALDRIFASSSAAVSAA